MSGENAYGDKELLFCYPPIVTRLFSWTTLTTPERSLRIWIAVLAVLAAAGAVSAARWRAQLGLEPIPDSLAVALVLFSTPVLFAIERGNYDLLILPFLIAGVALSRRRSSRAETIAGLLLATAIWLKLYPGLLLLGLLALGRFRLAAWTSTWLAVIGLSDLAELRQFLLNSAIHVQRAVYVARMAGGPPEAHPWNHPLGLTWQSLWGGTPLALVPGDVGAALLIGSLAAWLSWRVFRCEEGQRLALPYLLWLVAAGTFFPPVSNDYNLAPLLLALLAVWSRRDPWSHVAVAALLAWWQPVQLPLSGRVVLFMKLAGLIAVAFTIAHRADDRHRGAAEESPNQPGSGR